MFYLSILNMRHFIYSSYRLRSINRIIINNARLFSMNKNISKDIDNNEDYIKYSITKSAKWTAAQTRRGKKEDLLTPWYQPHVISFSIALFLVYFLLLREENDIDEKLSASLYNRIHGLEESQIHLSIAYNESQGLSTKELTERLEEIQKEKIKNI